MIVIVVEGGVVQAVYSDAPDEDVKVPGLDNAEDADSDVTPDQLHREIDQVAKEMHQLL